MPASLNPPFGAVDPSRRRRVSCAVGEVDESPFMRRRMSGAPLSRGSEATLLADAVAPEDLGEVLAIHLRVAGGSPHVAFGAREQAGHVLALERVERRAARI